MLPLTLFCQSYQIDKGKLEKLIQAYFYTLPACDSTVNAYQVALIKYDTALHRAEKVILIRTQERDLKVLESETWQKRFDNADALHESQLKTEKKKGFKWGAIITGTGFTILDILLILVLL